MWKQNFRQLDFTLAESPLPLNAAERKSRETLRRTNEETLQNVDHAFGREAFLNISRALKHFGSEMARHHERFVQWPRSNDGRKLSGYFRHMLVLKSLPPLR